MQTLNGIITPESGTDLAETDAQEYQRLIGEARSLTAKGCSGFVLSEIWLRIEAIKNSHGGYAPGFSEPIYPEAA